VDGIRFSLPYSLAKQAGREVAGVEEEELGSGLHSIEYSQMVCNYVCRGKAALKVQLSHAADVSELITFEGS
jgi:hypothetical protein